MFFESLTNQIKVWTKSKVMMNCGEVKKIFKSICIQLMNKFLKVIYTKREIWVFIEVSESGNGLNKKGIEVF